VTTTHSATIVRIVNTSGDWALVALDCGHEGWYSLAAAAAALIVVEHPERVLALADRTEHSAAMLARIYGADAPQIEAKLAEAARYRDLAAWSTFTCSDR
jgi:hypothetical protein